MQGTQYALNYTPCSIGTYISKKTGECFPAGCNSWACVDCGPRKVRRFLQRIAPPAWNYMATFTIEGDGSPTKENIKAINAHWRIFKRWLERNCKLEAFTWVNEQGGERGRLHKHALLRCNRISYRRARAALLRAGFGRVCDFSPIRNPRGARSYVSKYLSKSLPTKWPRYSRRCQTSCPSIKPSGEYMLQKWLRLPYRLTSFQIWKEEAYQEAITNEVEREYLATSPASPQLALIPNMKNCVRDDAIQEVLRLDNDRAGPISNLHLAIEG